MEAILFICMGIVIGVIVSKIFCRAKLIGSLRVDNSDPDSGPYLFLELSQGIGDIRRKKYVVLRVNLKNYISHE